MRIGVIGAGQLGMMLAEAGLTKAGYEQLHDPKNGSGNGSGNDLEFAFFDPNPESPAHRYGELTVGAFDDSDALIEFAKRVDCITYEFENIPSDGIDALQRLKPVAPSAQALRTSQDRLSEKSLFQELGIPVGDYKDLANAKDLESIAAEFGNHCVIKTRRLGYDGKGQFVVRHRSDLKDVPDIMLNVPCIVERFVPFSRELSIIACRSKDGEVVFYPLTQNTHREGILRVSKAPVLNIDSKLENQAREFISSIMSKFDYVGVLALELFECNGQLFANEMAPRVHNSGHWTIEGAHTSQFANHIRAVAELPLGSSETTGFAGMVNIIGREPTGLSEMQGVHLHSYRRSERPGRKLGHATIVASTVDELDQRLAKLIEVIEGARSTD